MRNKAITDMRGSNILYANEVSVLMLGVNLSLVLILGFLKTLSDNLFYL